MKRLCLPNVAGAVFLAGAGGMAAPMLKPAFAQTAPPRARKSSHTAVPVSLASRSEEARYLDGAIAMVNGGPITRREFILTLVALDPRRLGGFTLAQTPQSQNTLSVSLAALCRRTLADTPAEYERFVQDMMLMRAMQEAANAHHVPVTEAEIQAGVQASLAQRRRNADIPVQNPADLADRLGDTLLNVRRVVTGQALRQHLLAADLSERLGHPLRPDDFFSAHYLFLRARRDGQEPTDADLDAAKARAEQLRARILSKAITFEDAAAQNSDDVTKANRGSLGALPRTLLKAEMETTLLASQPGDLTPPVRVNDGYALARLDKRGGELTQAERDRALKLYTGYKKREEEMLARMLKNVQWTNTLGQPPSLNAALARRP